MGKRFLLVSADEADVHYLRQVCDAQLPMVSAIDAAATLSRALLRFKAAPPDLIIAACNLADSRGLATLERLLAASPRTPILTLHDDESDPLISAAMECGASGFLVRHRYGHYYTVLESQAALKLPPGTILVRPDGSEAVIEDSTAPIRTADGQFAGAVIVFHDVSAAHDMVQQMSHLATHDFLTDLPNRVMLHDRIRHAVATGERDRIGFAVLYLDLDNFKYVNDSLGHPIGDKLLRSVAARLLASVRGSDTVSRQGGDEFVMLVLDTFSRLDASIAADKILETLTKPHFIDGHELHISGSIGISQFPDDGNDAVTLIKHADTAMYEAKDKGKNKRQFFVSDMNARAIERQRIETNLRHALERGELHLHYQPKVDLRTGVPIGAEALMRWTHPDWGHVSPERFIHVAEDFGLIVPLGRWALRQACTQARAWQLTGMPLKTIAVNVSAIEFKRAEFADNVRAILDDTGLPPGCLELEITESVLMHDAEISRGILARLKNMGVGVAVDDFGTGYSSLSYLKRFPIDVLKIDKSFVSGIGTSLDDGSIAAAVISMGSNLKYKVVAEGVEDQFQLDFLRERHCDEAQGFFFSKPLDVTAFEGMMYATSRTWQQ